MVELKSKISKDDILEVDTVTMCLLKTIMFHAGIPESLITRFSCSNKAVIGEKAGKLIADKLDKAMELLVAGVFVERKTIENGRVVMKVAPVELTDLVYVKALSMFSRHKAPYEIH